MLPSSSARRWHCGSDMTKSSLAARVSALEEKMGPKTMEEQFREQAELITRLFLARDQKWDVRLGRVEADVSTLKTDVNTLKADVSILKADVSTLKTDVNTLKKDMVVVREGLGILLKRKG
jgi:hypothetical protein